MPDHRIDPETERELAALDAALHGSPDAEPALATLVADIRSTRPAADPIFLARLEEEVAAGFGHRTRPRLTGRWSPRLRILAPVGAAALAATIAAVVVTGQRDRPVTTGGAAATGSAQVETARTPAAGTPGRQSADQAASGGSSAPLATEAAPQADRAKATPQPATPSATLQSATAPGRKVERAAALTLATPRGRLQDATDRIVATTTRLGGYVASSSVSLNGNAGSARMRLRVPSARLDETLTELGRIAHVRTLDRSAVDITGGYNATAAGLQEARAERRGLLVALGRSTDEGQIARIKLRLRENAARLAAADAAMARMRARAERATIDVQLMTERIGEAPVPASKGFGIGAAAHSAVRVLSAAAGVLLLVAAAVLPLLVAVLLIITAVRLTRRRDRERALAQSAPTTAR